VNVINVRARSKFNKEDVKSVSVNADFQTSVADQPIENIPNQTDQVVSAGAIALDVYVSPNPTWMSIEADGNLVYSGVLLPESVQTFNANQKVSITSGKGNETFVKINGKDMGKLSSDNGVVRDILYDANGKIADKK
jgi:cytochrome c oxidase assembly protein Cox11